MAAQRADVQVFSTRAASSRGTRRVDRAQTWTEGNTVRAAVPARREWEEERPQVRPERRKQERTVPRMNIGYVTFLAFMSTLMVTVCAFYLKLQYRCTILQKTVTSLQSELASVKLENDEEYTRIMSGVNLETVKEEAMNRLGMVYAYEDQIVTYTAVNEDYVKQYQDIPD